MIPKLDTEYRYIRIQSTLCEAKKWDKLLQDLDYDFLMNLALGHKCIVYDYGANKCIPRSVYQGIEFIKYVLHRRWLHCEYVTNVNRSRDVKRKNNCNRYFARCYDHLEERTKKKLDYFLPYVVGRIDLECITDSTTHDGCKEFYKDILMRVAL